MDENAVEQAEGRRNARNRRPRPPRHWRRPSRSSRRARVLRQTLETIDAHHLAAEQRQHAWPNSRSRRRFPGCGCRAAAPSAAIICASADGASMVWPQGKRHGDVAQGEIEIGRADEIFARRAFQRPQQRQVAMPRARSRSSNCALASARAGADRAVDRGGMAASRLSRKFRRNGRAPDRRSGRAAAASPKFCSAPRLRDRCLRPPTNSRPLEGDPVIGIAAPVETRLDLHQFLRRAAPAAPAPRPAPRRPRRPEN